MNVFRRLALVIANLGLGLILFLLASVVILLFTLVNTDYVKRTLQDSRFYDNFVSSTLSLVTAKSISQPTLDRSQLLIKEVEPVIQKVVTPKIVQKYTELAIEGIEKWVKGQIQLANIQLDVKPVKDSLNVALSEHLQSKVATLPVCNSVQSSIDFDSTCRPVWQIPKVQFDRVASDLTASLPFLKNDTFVFGQQTEQDIKQNIPFAEAVPKVYKLITWSPYLLAFIGVLFLIIIYVLNQEKHKAWKTIGHTFLAAGLLLLVSGALAIIVIGKGIKPIETGSSREQMAFTNQLLLPIAKEVANSIGKWTVYFGVAYSVTGGACYFVSHRTQPKNNQPTPLT